MEIKQSNKYDDYTWVIKIIKSSVTIDQIYSSIRLIYSFDNKHNDEDLYYSLIRYKREQEHIIRYK